MFKYYYFGTNRTMSRNVLTSLLCIQVQMVSGLKHEHFVTLLGYCLEANNRILVYESATMGTLHDVLHGTSIAHSDSDLAIVLDD